MIKAKHLLFPILLWSPLFGAAQSITEQCVTTLWTSSSHPGGARGLNEHNQGIGFKCYQGMRSSNSRWFVHLDALENSRSGNTLTAGVGAEYKLLSFRTLSLYAGGALSPTYYEVKEKGSRLETGKRTIGEVFIPIMPSLHYGVSLNLPYGIGLFSAQQSHLPGSIRIRSLNFEIKTNFL